MNAFALVSQAVEMAIDRNSRLIVQPYEQMKAAALILAERVIALESVSKPVASPEPSNRS